MSQRKNTCPRLALSRLLVAIDRPSSQWDLSDVVQRGAAMRGQPRTGAHVLPIWRVVELAQELLGDPMVTVDAGAHMLGVTWFWRSERPNRFHISNGLGTMGFALPAAIGLAIASPGEFVLAFTGDGGFTMNAAELETAARSRAKVIVLVLNDASLSLIRVKQADVGPCWMSVDFERCDSARVAPGFGVRGARASSEAELCDTLLNAVAAQGRRSSMSPLTEANTAGCTAGSGGRVDLGAGYGALIRWRAFS